MRGEGVPDLDDRAFFPCCHKCGRMSNPGQVVAGQNGRTTTMTTMTTSATVGASFISR